MANSKHERKLTPSISQDVETMVNSKRSSLEENEWKAIVRQANDKTANTTAKALLRPRWVFIDISSAFSKRGPYSLFSIPKLYSIDGAKGEANVIKST